MTLEISDCTSIELDWETNLSDSVPKLKEGPQAINDTISPLAAAPKPPFYKRVLFSVGLLTVHFATLTLRLCHWLLEKITGPCPQKRLYQKLHHIASEGAIDKTQVFLIKHANEENAAGFLFKDFLKLPEIHFFLPEILKGANVSLLNDNGHFFKRWKGHSEAYQRISSHEYVDDECYAIGHFLFWLDHSGQTRFQFENSPLKGFFSAIEHAIDYLRYKRDNEQQGVMGTSPYTEGYQLAFSVNPQNFISIED